MAKKITVCEEDLLDYPKTLELYKFSPEISGKYLIDLIERMWSGQKKEALAMIEAFLNNGGVL